MATSRLCSIQNCDKPAKCRGWCTAHYRRWGKHGSPNIGPETIISPGERMKYLVDEVLTYEGDNCLTWPFGRSGGRATIYKDGQTQQVSRIVCEYVYGPPPSAKHEAAHNCGRGHEACCNKRHLRWATNSENQLDRAIHGTDNRGERSTSVKITADDVLFIRAMKGIITGRELAKKFGVTFNHISGIQHHKTWKWLSPPD